MRFVALLLAVLPLASLLPTANGLSATDNATCGCHPDPHFVTWDNTFYDYHGGCDLVLITNSLLDLHVMTVPLGGYAGISKVALTIGGDTLEIQDDVLAPGTPETVLHNGIDKTSAIPPTLGGYTLTKTLNTPYSGTIQYKVTLAAGQFININKFFYGLDVQVLGTGSFFAGSEGMCGSWDDGGVNKRDGTPLTDITQIADEWQVTYGEHSFVEPWVASTCAPPPECGKEFPLASEEFPFPCKEDRPDGGGVNRKLQVDPPTCDRTCDDIPADLPEYKLNCVFDTVITGDGAWACAPAYIDPVVFIRRSPCDQDVLPENPCVSKDNLCQKRGGRCVEDCKDDDITLCLPDLCTERNGNIKVAASGSSKEMSASEGGTRNLQKEKKCECFCAIPMYQVVDALFAASN